ALLFFTSSRLLRDLHSFPTRRSSDLLVWQLCQHRASLFLSWRRFPVALTDGTLAFLPVAGMLGVMQPEADIPIEPSATAPAGGRDRKSTRLNSSHSQISYAVFCLKKK